MRPSFQEVNVVKDLIFLIVISVICAIIAIVFAFIYSVALNRLFLAFCFAFLMVSMYGVLTAVGCL